MQISLCVNIQHFSDHALIGYAILPGARLEEIDASFVEIKGHAHGFIFQDKLVRRRKKVRNHLGMFDCFHKFSKCFFIFRIAYNASFLRANNLRQKCEFCRSGT